jgi:hypothetical protein
MYPYPAQLNKREKKKNDTKFLKKRISELLLQYLSFRKAKRKLAGNLHHFFT